MNVWLPAGRAWSQSTVEILTSSVAYQFGESLTFQAVFRADQPIQEVHVLFNSADGAFSGSGKAQTVSGKSYAYTYGLENSPLRPFSRVDYRFQVLLADGTLVNTSDRSFIYRDNRFEWFTAAEDNLTVRLDRADPAFAAETLAVAQTALERIKELGVQAPQENVEIYVYSSAASMQEALDLIGPGWSAGHANPDLGIVLVTLPQGPQQRLVMEQRIPHELMHVMLFRMLGAGYFLLPAWLSEGLATAAELYPNPDYQVLLEDARQAGKLLNFSSLCEIFPRETSQTLLAYAQAGSFMRFLEKRFGSSGIQALLNSYASGTDCAAGTEAALGQPLNRLEREWRQQVFGENPTWLIIANLMPWIVILIAVLSAPVALFFYAWRKRPVITT
ncbi:MAG TPA: peptidase MA family metallohydrolase [Anaerolineales bacterium]|nr:peptidase MA family metallohydrolase [Anaerolineales bacterium]